jgi:hypothetical protein
MTDPFARPPAPSRRPARRRGRPAGDRRADGALGLRAEPQRRRLDAGHGGGRQGGATVISSPLTRPSTSTPRSSRTSSAATRSRLATPTSTRCRARCPSSARATSTTSSSRARTGPTGPSRATSSCGSTRSGSRTWATAATAVPLAVVRPAGQVHDIRVLRHRPDLPRRQGGLDGGDLERLKNPTRRIAPTCSTGAAGGLTQPPASTAS